ncbi:S41 family peptidase [Marinilabiliaceae bacterium ANBcel2]|nr:S41 family peptidase [Marinilabiliaceae bacterium ANBcel2]
MREQRLIITIAVTIIITLFSSCDKDEATNPGRYNEMKPRTERGAHQIDIKEINEFIHSNMNFGYYWNKEMPDIDYTLESNPFDYFDKLLYNSDRWSYITDDVVSLFEFQSGVARGVTGLSLQAYYLNQETNRVILYTRYVYPGSPAEEANLKRGDVISRINNQEITDQNYQQLLAMEPMEITLGDIIDDEIVDHNENIVLHLKDINLNPVVKSTVINNEQGKTGYLAYTSFTSEFDTAMVNAFQNFNKKGIDELILDLRYNTGGAVSSAELLASLIAPESAQGEMLVKEMWNENFTNYLKEENNADDSYFISTIEAHEDNVNLNRLYVLTTENSASASELLIYGLKPYMDVVTIGETTYGKYFGSVTFYDTNKHSWAIQPITMSFENSDNSIDYSKGIDPNHYLIDNIYNAELGDPKEHFTHYALTHIATGVFPVEDEDELKSLSKRALKLPVKKDIPESLEKSMWVDSNKRFK